GKATRAMLNTGLGDTSDPTVMAELQSKHPARKEAVLSPLGSELVVSSRDVPAAVSGLPTDRSLFAVDLTTRTLRDWAPPVTSLVDHVLGMDDVVILGGSSVRVDGVEGELFAVDAASGAPLPWEVSYNGTVTSLHRLGDQVAFTTDFSEILVADPPGVP
ncbi:MAG: hypothetical protein AAF602_10460, partial [Myxococcota bacterium]